MMFKSLILSLYILFFLTSGIHSQNQKEADSILGILNQDKNISDSISTNLIYLLTIKSSLPEDKLTYADLLLEKSKSYRHTYYSIQAYNAKGVAYRLKGDLESSLKNLFESARLATTYNNPVFEAEAYSEISNTYIANNDFSNSLVYQTKAIDIFREHKINKQLCIALLNTGFNYYTIGEYDIALSLYDEAEPIFEIVEMTIGKAYTIGNRALIYWKQGDYKKAEKDLFIALQMLEPLGDQFGMADYHNQLGAIYLEQNNVEKAIFHTQKSMSMAEDLGLKEQLRDAAHLLSKLYKNKGEYQEALQYQTQYIAYKDSLENKEQTKKIADIRTDFEVSLKEKEIDLLEKREILNTTYIIIAIILLFLSIVLLLYFRQRFLTTNLIASREKKEHNDKIKNVLKDQETKVLQSMIKGRDQERKHLAQELHNHLGSILATIKVNINSIKADSIPNHTTITTLVDQACSDIRTISHSLNMGVSEDFGLALALKELTTHLKESNELKVELSISMCEGLLDAEEEIIIYRIIQELISNVLKYAKANKLSILLICFEEENLINILIQDDGIGFNTEEKHDGMGLKTTRQTVKHLGGDISIDSNSNSGTTVNIDLPISINSNLL